MGSKTCFLGFRFFCWVVGHFFWVVGSSGGYVRVSCGCSFFFFFWGALRRSLLYLWCNLVALNLRFFDIYNITYKKKEVGHMQAFQITPKYHHVSNKVLDH